MKRIAVMLLTVLVLWGVTLPASAAELTLPTVENEGNSYYQVGSKEDYFKAARYLLDNRLEEVPVFIDATTFTEFKSDRAWFNNVTNFDYQNEKLYYTYVQYSTNSVWMSANDYPEGDLIYGSVRAQYFDTDEELAKADAMLDAELAKISEYSKIEKIRYVAEFICRTVDAGSQEMPGGGYDAINGVYDLLTGVRTNTVCSSFTYLFQRFMERAGYPSYIATGTGVCHAWNVVELDGIWYGVDCTYADNGTAMNEAYFLMGMDRMSGYILPTDTQSVFTEMEQELGCRFAKVAYGKEATTTKATTTTTAAATTKTSTTTKAATTTTVKATAATTTATTTVDTTTTTATTMTSEVPTATTTETTVATTRPASDDASAPNNGWIPWTAAGVVLCGGGAAAGLFLFKKK